MKEKLFAILLAAVMLAGVLAVPGLASGEASHEVNGGTLNETADYGENAVVEIKAVPTSEGSVTLTVDGAERDLVPGIYTGHVVLTVTEKNPVEYAKGNMTHEFRQAAYIDENGLSADKSVLAAVQGGSAIMIFDTAGGSAKVDGSTVIEAGRAVFLTRSGVANIAVDGAEGAELRSDIGVILQMIDLDKAARENVEIDGVTYSVYPGPWTEPYASYDEIELSASAEPTEATSRDVVAHFSDIELEGDFYNGTTGAGTVQNLQLTLDNATVNGVISASFARHEKAELYPEDWQCIGVVENTVYPAINNGVLLTLENGAVWNVTGVSYLTSLTIDGTSTVNGIVTVDGAAVAPVPGTYTGTIAVYPADAPSM